MQEKTFALEVRSRTDVLEHVVREFTERRMSFALDRLKNLRRMVISIEDVNGPKGGVDKRCRILAEFGPTLIIIEENQPRWQTAIALAVRRLARRATLKLHLLNRPKSHRPSGRPRRSARGGEVPGI